jgi:glycosyltransferase involved in cell wall biosynthesis
LRSGGAAECYTRVDDAYAIAKRRGMDLVTLADHDTIDGALELCSRHPGDTFVSVEISARFPEDGCIVHVIAIAVTEDHHRELQRLRRNVYEVAAYLEHAGIAHFWCHPLSQVNGRLRGDHIERCFLMFRAIELRNGTRDVAHERRLLEIINRLTPAIAGDWAADHPQVPFINRAARWACVAGSDDHGSLAIARAHTRFAGAATVEHLITALQAGTTEPCGESGTGTTLAHNCYGVLAGYLRATDQRDLVPHDSAASQLWSVLFDDRAGAAGDAGSLLSRSGHTTIAQDFVRDQVEPRLVEAWRGRFAALFESLGQGRWSRAAEALPAIVNGLLLELPYVLAHRYHARDRRGANRFAAELHGAASAPGVRVAVFTDTIDDINGVALGLHAVHAEARRAGFDLRLVGCGRDQRLHVDAAGIVRVPSLFEHRLAEYPQMTWSIPHLVPILRFLTEQEIELVQCSTPGPLGVAALIAARITGTPVIGQYHTDVPEYALRLSGDPAAAAVVRALVGWFYRALDRVLVPSRWIGDVVRGLGVPADRIEVVPRGIDLARFSPTWRTADAFAQHAPGHGPTLLYVGRLSREKGLDRVLAAFVGIARELPDARLVIVGDGPLRAELERAPIANCVFTGQVTGPELSRLYASADVFVFLSETETFGNVVVEAQASGLPALVAHGATSELIVHGVTGFAVDPSDPHEVHRLLVRLLRDDELRRRMRREAVHHAQRYELASAVSRLFERYARMLDPAAAPARSHGLVA